MRTSRTGRRSVAHRDERGFTLIELLVVLTLIAIFATLAAPVLRTMLPAAELRTEAEGLRSELRLLRGEAIGLNRETWMLFDVAERSYATGDGKRSHLLAGDVGMELLAGATEIVDDASGRIRFFPDGTSTGGSVLLSRDGQAYEVVVDWFDGSVDLRQRDAE